MSAIKPQASAADRKGKPGRIMWCVACLSRGRRVSPLGTVRAAHVACDAQWNVTQVKDVGARLQVCWECRALVDKSLLFCERVRRAQAVLTTVTNEHNVESISALGTAAKIGFDYQFRFAQDEDDRAPNWETPILTEVKIEVQDDRYGDITVEPKLEPGHFINIKELNDPIGEPSTSTQTIDNVKSSDDSPSEIKESIVSCKVDGVTKEDRAPSPNIVDGVRVIVISDAERLRIRDEDRNSEKYVKSLFKCETCLKGFLNAVFLKDHNENKHKLELGRYPCDICAVRFPKRKALTGHRSTHFRRYECSACPFAHRSLFTVRRHHRDTHRADRLYPCTRCDKVFAMHQQLKIHRMRGHAEKRKCPHCGKLFERYNYKKHVMSHEDRQELECAVCQKRYRGKQSLKAHMRTHAASRGEDAFCVECDRQFRDVHVFRQHLASSVKHVRLEEMRHACGRCERRFISPKELRIHTDLVHLKKELFKCKPCDKNYKTLKGLKLHKLKVHEGVRPAKDKYCDICDRGFSSKNTMEAHRRIHTGERPYKCKQCDSTFRQSGAVYTHMKLVHGYRGKRQRQ